jgi:hypothetical protein
VSVKGQVFVKEYSQKLETFFYAAIVDPINLGYQIRINGLSGFVVVEK